ncbi:MAG: PD40 domain-containing protein [Phycisphaeraceae bacterium]|nr:PD40 domain-containing protein [Phycisphaerales bacterium]MCB9860483.1 PD40 domain-containing protein [Phycisphaeraceae bacterium]
MGKLIRTTLVLLVALVVVGGLAFATLGAWQRAQSSGTYYTDNAPTDTIRESASVAAPRDILWKPATALARGINSPRNELDPGLSADGTILFFSRASERGDADIYFVQRNGFGWTEPAALDTVNSDRDDLGPQPTLDGKAIVFASNRSGGQGGYDLWIARKGEEGWLPAENLGEGVNTPYHEYAPAISPDNASLVFATNRPDVAPEQTNVRQGMFQGDFDLYIAALADGTTIPARMLVSLSTDYDDISPAFSPAGDYIYFASDRLESFGGFDIFRSRISPEGIVAEQPIELSEDDVANEDNTLDTLLARDGLINLVNLGQSVNSPHNELDPTLSFDGFELHFSSDRTPWIDSDDNPDAGKVSYDIYRTVAREVVTEYDPGQARLSFMDWLSRVWPMVATVLLLLVLLALLGWLRTTEMWAKRWKPLSLIAKCFIVSVIAHMLLFGGMAVWNVYGTLDGTSDRNVGAQQPIVVRTVSNEITRQLRGEMSQMEIAATESPSTPQAEQAEIEPLEVAATELTPTATQAEAAQAFEQKQATDTSAQNPQMVARAETQVPQSTQVNSAEPTPDAAVAVNEQNVRVEARADAQTPRAASEAPTPMQVANAAMNPEAVQAGPSQSLEQTHAADTSAQNPQMTARAEAQVPQSSQVNSAEPTPAAALATSEQAVHVTATADSQTPRAQNDAPAPMQASNATLTPDAVQAGPTQAFATPQSTDAIVVQGPQMAAQAPVSQLPTETVNTQTPQTQAAVAQNEVVLDVVPTGVDAQSQARAETESLTPIAAGPTEIAPESVNAEADRVLASKTSVAESSAETALPESAISEIENPAAMTPMPLAAFDAKLDTSTPAAASPEQSMAIAPDAVLEITPAELTSTETYTPITNATFAIEDTATPLPTDSLATDILSSVDSSAPLGMDIALPAFDTTSFDAPDTPVLSELNDVQLPIAEDSNNAKPSAVNEPNDAIADASMIPLPSLQADVERDALDTMRADLKPTELGREHVEALSEQAYTPDAMPEFDIMPPALTELGSIPEIGEEAFDIALPAEQPDPEPEPSADPEKHPGLITGMVIDARTRRPIRDAMVKLDLDEGNELVYLTDVNGQFELEPEDLPDNVAVSASADGYTPESTNIRSEDVRRGVRVVFMLAPIDSDVIVLEADPDVHHLGNDEFSGRINSQFQKKSEGLRWVQTFELTEDQIGDDLTRAEIRLLARGTQAPNEIWINDRLLPKRLDGSPRDGSFGQFRANVPADWLQLGENKIDIRSRRGTADLDDFEFVNVQFHLQRQQRWEPRRNGRPSLE